MFLIDDKIKGLLQYEITESSVMESNADPMNIREVILPNHWNWVGAESFCRKFEQIGPKLLMTKMV